MKTAELKIAMIDQIIHSQSDDLIVALHSLVEAFKGMGNEFPVTEEMKAAIDAGQADFANGDFEDASEVWKEIEAEL